MDERNENYKRPDPHNNVDGPSIHAETLSNQGVPHPAPVRYIEREQFEVARGVGRPGQGESGQDEDQQSQVSTGNLLIEMSKPRQKSNQL